jgi:hypothetical protein
MLLVVTLSGCVYGARIYVESSSTAGPELTEQDVDRAVAVVGRIAAESGLIPDPRLDEFEQSREAETRTVGQWVLGPSSATWKRVAVYAQVDNETDRFSVLVRDLDSARSTDFTRALETRLSQALTEAFPSSKIEVERSTIGPIFGP